MTSAPGAWEISQAAKGIAAITSAARGEADVSALAYLALYACGFAGEGKDLDRYRLLATCARDEVFVAHLFHQVPDSVVINGWKVTECDGERVLIAKDGMEAFVWCRELTSPPVPGGAASFTVPVLGAGRMPGFVMREGASSLRGRSKLSRLYLNIRPSLASWALGSLARELDVAGLEYEMKVLANPRAYIRRDSCVVYVATEDEERAIRLVTDALEQVPARLVGRTTPRLTGRVAPGVGLAHEPTDLSDDGLSHGQWVARLFSTAARDSSDPAAIARRVRTLISEAGRDPNRPYLRRC